MKVVKDYLSSLKSVYVEEFIDLFFFRPLAYLLLKIFYILPITPNQISFLAMIIGIFSGIYFSKGNYHGFILGGILYGIFNVVDCLDGMIARVKKNGTKTGRLVDGMVDYIVSAAVFFGFAVGLTKAVRMGTLSLPFKAWFLIIIAGISTMIHALLTDKFRNLYETHVNGKFITPQHEIQEFTEELERLKRKGGRYFDKLLIRSYLRYSYLQIGKMYKSFIKFDPKEYEKHNKLLVALWNFVGYSTHITFFMISAFLFKPMIFFCYSIVFANLWVLIMFFLQARANKKIVGKFIEQQK